MRKTEKVLVGEGLLIHNKCIDNTTDKRYVDEHEMLAKIEIENTRMNFIVEIKNAALAN